MLSGYCLPGSAQTLSQTKTANRFNCFGEGFLNLWSKWGVEYVTQDDNSYAYSKSLSSGRGTLQLQLDDFRFNIPADATITSITVSVRRFKKGKGSIKDYYANLIAKNAQSVTTSYGFRWADVNNYPDVETEVTYVQNGSGNGGSFGTTPYQWTPGMINDLAFGVRITTYNPVGGSVVVYYDQALMTVEYTVPLVTTSAKLVRPTEIKPLLQPRVYPNPFTTNTSIQFTATETGNAVVELYNISGIKVSTLFSGNVVRGQVYNVETMNARLRKGNYVYVISNGIQKHSGRIIKLE